MCGFTVENYPRGYPRVAALQDSDAAFTMFRQFKMLHCRLLLLNQEELCSLEEKLHQVDVADRTQLHLSSRTHDANLERQNLLSEIRDKLRQYGSFSKEDSLCIVQRELT